MPQQAFSASAGAPGNVLSWTGSGRVFGNATTPIGRKMANGDTRILPTGIVMYLGGYGAARTATLYVGGASLNVPVPAANGGQAVGGATTTRNLIGGGGAGVQHGAYHSGSMYYGWQNLAGRNLYDNAGGVIKANAEIAGYYDWAQAPSAPGTPSLSLNGQVATVSWAGPADNGGVGVSGYTVQYSKSSSFSSGVSTVTTSGGSVNIALPESGVTYYFRVAARNEVTALAGTTGPFGGARSLFVPSGGWYRSGSTWRPRVRRWRSGSTWRPVRRWYRDGSTWKPIR